TQETIDLYKKLANAHSSNLEVYIGLAESYAASRQQDQQISALERAVHLAESQSDGRLEELRNALQALRP
ncbi:MAG: hypothetical protein AAF170_06305, partial [Bacteroidota bacterium]